MTEHSEVVTTYPVETIETDVAIVGAGPAGATAAALLAQKGFSVRIIERETFPRFRIGESLLPGGNALLKRLGIWEKMDEAGFIRKYGAEFVSADGQSRVHNVFADGLIKDMDHTYQVERARFDKLLLDNAVEKGAELVQPAKVVEASQAEEGWKLAISTEEGRHAINCKWLLDGSGRTAFVGKRLRLEQDDIPYPKRFAVYNHFEGIPRRSGKEAGNIIITRLSNGWFWAIPLDENKTSVGVVSTRDKEEWKQDGFTPQTFFQNQVDRAPFLSELMAEAKPCDEYRVTADYTYSFSQYAGSNYVLMGDAAGFIDPIFSSGVYLAMRSASMAADAVIAAEAESRQLTRADCETYTKQLKRNVRVMRDLIEVYYDQKGYSVFMSPTERFKLFQAVNSIVAGNSSPNLAVRWRFRLFLFICRLNRRFSMVPDQALT